MSQSPEHYDVCREHDRRHQDDIFILLTSVLGAYGFEIALRGVLLDYFSVKMTSLASLISMLAAFLVGLFVQHRSSK
eukprot:g10336.t1